MQGSTEQHIVDSSTAGGEPRRDAPKPRTALSALGRFEQIALEPPSRDDLASHRAHRATGAAALSTPVALPSKSRTNLRVVAPPPAKGPLEIVVDDVSADPPEHLPDEPSKQTILHVEVQPATPPAVSPERPIAEVARPTRPDAVHFDRMPAILFVVMSVLVIASLAVGFVMGRDARSHLLQQRAEHSIIGRSPQPAPSPTPSIAPSAAPTLVVRPPPRPLTPARRVIRFPMPPTRTAPVRGPLPPAAMPAKHSRPYPYLSTSI